MTDQQPPAEGPQPGQHNAWPTMNERSGPADGRWPVRPSSQAPATEPAVDPLATARRKTLAPQGMPHQAPAPGTPAPALSPAPNPQADPLATPVAGETPVDPDPSVVAAAADRSTEPTRTGPVAKVPCPHCGEQVSTYESFCEACGGELTPTAERPADLGDVGQESPIQGTRATHQAGGQDPDLSQPASRTCSECGGVVGPDGYCTQCGSKALSARDHWSETPSSWVAGCCDKGIRHHRNEDAMGLTSEPEPLSRAVLVVCDGVSSSTDSDVAALAGARRARDVLTGARPAGLGTPESRAGAMGQAFVRAAEEANQAVIAHTDPQSDNAASCTFVAAVIEDGQVYYANVGDSRAYWIDDEPEKSLMLSLDDSVAQARIAMGVAREEAEHGFQSHAITKWLGRDAEDVVPRTGVVPLGERGWVLVCSDGLWNYCSEPDDLARLFLEQLAASVAARTPTGLAERLVAWANEQGGKDNITVTLARVGDLPDLPAPPAALPRADAAPVAAVPTPADAPVPTTQPTAGESVTGPDQPPGATAAPRPSQLRP